MAASSEPIASRLADPALRRDVQAAVRRRIRGDEAEDVVQATFADVLEAEGVPEDPEEFRRFVFGVARNKVFDHFRRRRRETSEDAAFEPAESEPPLSARDILRWAEGELPDSESKHTLEWMLREGAGEKLEHIARDANLPAPRVRQRVSRLRRFLRERWAAELLLGGLGVLLLAGAVYYALERRSEVDVVKPEPKRPVPEDQRGRELRRAALEHCRAGEARRCLEELDRARFLDPIGDAAAEVLEARRQAALRLAPSATPSTAPAPAPSTPPAPVPRRPQPAKTNEAPVPSDFGGAK